MNAPSPTTFIAVDGGSFAAAAGAALTRGTSRPRREDVMLDVPRVVDVIHELTSSEDTIHWYDGERTDREPSDEHVSLSTHEKIAAHFGPLRMRQGRWTQKRVDAMIQRDIVNAASAGVKRIALFASDEDLVIAAQEARRLGATVTLFAVRGVRDHSCSPHLQMACDETVRFGIDVLRPCVGLSPRAGMSQVAAAMMHS